MTMNQFYSVEKNNDNGTVVDQQFKYTYHSGAEGRIARMQREIQHNQDTFDLLTKAINILNE